MERELGFVRRSVLAAGVAAALAAGTITAIVAVHPAAAGPPTINDYAVFGLNSVHIGFSSTVTGLVGAANDRTAPLPNPSTALKLDGGASIVGHARVGPGTTSMNNNTTITGTLLHSGPFSGASSATVGTNIVGNPQLPTSIPSQWPAPGAAVFCATNHSPDINNGNGTTISLTPGTWGDVKAGGVTNLNFNGAGDYFLDSLTIGNGVNLSLTPGIRLFVCTKVSLGNIVSTPPAGFMPSDFYTEVTGIPGPVDTNGFEVSNGPWVGNVVAPTTGIHYGSGSSASGTFFGFMWAEHVDLEHSVQVHVPTSPPTTSTDTSSSTSSSTSTSTSSSTSSTSSSSTSTSTTTTTEETTFTF